MLPVLALVPNESRTLEVYAAASLREAFTELARTFERQHPGVSVRMTFAGSQTLAAQIRNGAPADVFASASPKNLAGLAYDPATRRVFATNRLVLIGVTSLAELTHAPRIVLAAPAVPVGAYSEAALRRAGQKLGAGWLASVRSHVVSQENDVRAVLAKVRLREADAGIVYATDAMGTPLPQPFQPRIEYPAVVPQDAPQPLSARAFVALLVSRTGRHILSARGFGVP